MRVHIYSRRPRLLAVFFRGGLGGRMASISRRSARRINSEKLISSRRRFIEQELLDLSREPERHRHTAFEQLRSGHEAMCIIVSYTLSRLNFLALPHLL